MCIHENNMYSSMSFTQVVYCLLNFKTQNKLKNSKCKSDSTESPICLYWGLNLKCLYPASNATVKFKYTRIW